MRLTVRKGIEVKSREGWVKNWPTIVYLLYCFCAIILFVFILFSKVLWNLLTTLSTRRYGVIQAFRENYFVLTLIGAWVANINHQQYIKLFMYRTGSPSPTCCSTSWWGWWSGPCTGRLPPVLLTTSTDRCSWSDLADRYIVGQIADRYIVDQISDRYIVGQI